MKNPPLHRYATRPGLYFTDDGGADVVVRSETADQVWLCVLEPIDEPSAFFQDAIRLFEDPNISFIQQIHEVPSNRLSKRQPANMYVAATRQP